MSENPESNEQKRTIGSVKSILNGRIQILHMFFNVSLLSETSSGPHMFNSLPSLAAALRLLLASLSSKTEQRVSGTVIRCIS